MKDNKPTVKIGTVPKNPYNKSVTIWEKCKPAMDNVWALRTNYFRLGVKFQRLSALYKSLPGWTVHVVAPTVHTYRRPLPLTHTQTAGHETPTHGHTRQHLHAHTHTLARRKGRGSATFAFLCICQKNTFRLFPRAAP